MQALAASIQHFSGNVKSAIDLGDAAAVAEIDKLVDELRGQVDEDNVALGLASGGDIGIAITSRHVDLAEGTVINCAIANHFSKIITGPMTFSVTNLPKVGQALTIALHLQVATPSLVTYWDGVEWLGSDVAPTLQTDRPNVLYFTTVDGGVSWTGMTERQAQDLDLSNYATIDQLPDLTPYAKVTDLPDLTPYALDADIPDVTPFAKTADLPNFGSFLSRTGDAVNGKLAAQGFLDRTRQASINSAGQTVALDLAKYNVFHWVLDGNLTMTVPGTMPAGPWDQWPVDDQFSKVTMSIVVRLVMGATLRTVTWWNNITWLTTNGAVPAVPAVGKVCEYVLSTTDGVNWYGREGARN